VAARGRTRKGGKVRVLTHCNTGSLATAAYGTALGVLRALHEAGALEHAYCTETRPYNQGARGEGGRGQGGRALPGGAAWRSLRRGLARLAACGPPRTLGRVQVANPNPALRAPIPHSPPPQTTNRACRRRAPDRV
jgi:hypothetical protein